MKSKNKQMLWVGDPLLNKGFTLIELLAVIVILAIIALIAVPIILNIINDSKRNAVIRSGELYLDAVNQAIARKNLTEEFNPKTCTIKSDGNLNCDNDKDLTVETTGDRPISGTIYFEDGTVKDVGGMRIGDYELETDPKTGRLRIAEPDTEPPVIVKVEFAENEITVEAKDNSNGKLYYSFDGGETYIEENTFEVTESGTYTIYVKDEAGNVSNPEEITVTYDPTICKLYKPNTTPNAPDLYNNTLTPIIYDKEYNNGEDKAKGAWLVADTTKQWYDYSKQEWANAVILNTGVSRTTGQVVDVETDVRAMFVWIPRYEYRIEETSYGKYGKCGTKTSSPGAIDIRFISNTVTTSSSSEYYLHPAFWWDKDDDGVKDNDEWLSGIWVGKFETSAEKGRECTVNANSCNNTNYNPYILPNSNSLRKQSVSNQFATAQKFTSLLSGADAHMAKNSEWGAVAYLSQSIYGKYGNSNYTTIADKEVYINNSSEITGRSGGAPGGSVKTVNAQFGSGSSSSQDNQYGYYTYDGYAVDVNGNITETKDELKGTGASTTGNITGVYDMSGGSYEAVMGNLNKTTGSSGFDSTWFTTEGNAKYYDEYTSTNPSSSDKSLALKACNGGVCYGHALSETVNWYGDGNVFVSSTFPWFSRGGTNFDSSRAGVFYSNSFSGADYGNSFRVVLVGD